MSLRARVGLRNKCVWGENDFANHCNYCNLRLSALGFRLGSYCSHLGSLVWLLSDASAKVSEPKQELHQPLLVACTDATVSPI